MNMTLRMEVLLSLVIDFSVILVIIANSLILDLKLVEF